ncbi:MAG: DUF5106 domain-containing protein [Saprospiraceae bacterium]|nr:DUF5106 domain-containing protein [Saprospiraceae bacterium]
MNQINIILLFLYLILFSNYTFSQYKITVNIEGYKNDTCILGYQIGQSTYIAQSLYKKNKKGAFVFEGEESLLGGLYSILIKPDNKYFQFIISNDEEQKNLILSTRIDKNPAIELTENLVIKNSPDNKVFNEYKNFLGKMRLKSDNYSSKLNEAKSQNDSVSIKRINEYFAGLDKTVYDFQNTLAEKYPTFLSPKLIIGGRNPIVPKHLTSRTEIFHYYKNHFWDNVDFSDERLIRTPIFKDKMNTYLEKLTPQTVDSIAKSCEYMIDKALEYKNKKVFQFFAVQLLNRYAKQEVICMDGVYVTIAQKYYCTGLAYWLDSTKLENICDDAAKMAPLRCGKNAPEIRLKNINDSSYVSLYNIRKKFVAVYFWDPTCGNCAKVSKKLIPVYNKWKEKGFEIYGVCSKPWKEVSLCRKKEKETEMTWVNTTDDPYPLAWVKKYYDLRSNPFIYLLGENKEILYKRISAEQLDEILERELGKNK